MKFAQTNDDSRHHRLPPVGNKLGRPLAAPPGTPAERVDARAKPSRTP